MPESKRRPEAEKKKLAARRAEEAERHEAHTGKLAEPNAPWFVPVMVAFMVLGVLWIATYYITQGEWPVKKIEWWNLVVGMGLIMMGFAMATRWR